MVAINQTALRRSKRLLKSSEVALHIISEPRSEFELQQAVMHLPVPLQFRRAAYALARRGGPGFCLPFVGNDGLMHAIIYSDSRAMMHAAEGAISPQFQKMLATFIHRHERGHALDPQLWASLQDQHQRWSRDEIVSWHEARERLRSEQFADVYALFHMIADLKPSLKETQAFLHQWIALREQGTSLEHQTAPVLKYFAEHLPEIHAKIVNNPNAGSRHAQAAHYTERFMMDYAPSQQHVLTAARRAEYNLRVAQQRAGYRFG